ncbi:putative CCCH-type zinc finger family protein [Tanacetum coccineum]
MASESAFSIGRRVLDPYRTSLSSQLVEAFFCTQDWIRRERMERNVDGIEDLSIDYEVVKEMKEVIRTQRLAQLEPSQEEEEFESDDAFQNPFYRLVRQREPPMRNDRKWEASIKVELPEFFGTLKAEEFVDWLNTVDRVFKFKDAPENKKLKWVAIKQGIKTVEEYTEEFYELVSRNDLSDTEEQLVSRYLGGLHQSIQDVLCLYTFWIVSEVYQRALAVEKQQTRSGNRSEGSQNKFAGVKQAEHGAKSQEYDVGMSKRPTTMRGSGVGNTTSSSNKTFKCFKCGEPGHKSLDCRNERGKQLMIENEKHESDDYEDEEKYTVEPSYDEYEENKEDNFVYGYTGQMLVIRKRLLLPKVLVYG